jgi:RNA polymerase sigma factor (sigma-70 family)
MRHVAIERTCELDLVVGVDSGVVLPARHGDVRQPLIDQLLARTLRLDVHHDSTCGLLALDDALESLSRTDQRRSRVVELRFFGGLTVEETAAVLDVSPETVMRDWKVAKAWLFKQLNPAKPTAS